MLNVILTSQIRPWFVYLLSLDLPSNWPAVFLTPACVWLISACFSNKYIFHSHFPVRLGPPHTSPFTVCNTMCTRINVFTVQFCVFFFYLCLSFLSLFKIFLYVLGWWQCEFPLWGSIKYQSIRLVSLHVLPSPSSSFRIPLHIAYILNQSTHHASLLLPHLATSGAPNKVQSSSPSLWCSERDHTFFPVTAFQTSHSCQTTPLCSSCLP